jgi:hypothetical protein
MEDPLKEFHQQKHRRLSFDVLWIFTMSGFSAKVGAFPEPLLQYMQVEASEFEAFIGLSIDRQHFMAAGYRWSARCSRIAGTSLTLNEGHQKDKAFETNSPFIALVLFPAAI